MGRFSAGQIVFVPFPYSDLTDAKARPAVLVVDAGNEDWVVCQITSNPFADPTAIPLTDRSFRTGGLRKVSYLRPSKLFTAHESLVISDAGILHADVLKSVREAIVKAIRG